MLDDVGNAALLHLGPPVLIVGILPVLPVHALLLLIQLTQTGDPVFAAPDALPVQQDPGFDRAQCFAVLTVQAFEVFAQG